MANKSTEEKVKDAFLRKLIIKNQGINLEIPEMLYAELVLEDIALLASHKSDLDAAIAHRVQEGKPEDIMKITLKEAIDNYPVELSAYTFYLDNISNPKVLKRMLYADILRILNDEPKQLTARLHEILRIHLSPMVENVDTSKLGFSKEDLLFLIAYQIENLARYSDPEDCARIELAEGNYTEEKFEQLVEATKNKYIAFAPSVCKQIDAYKKAIAAASEGKELYTILEDFKRNLK